MTSLADSTSINQDDFVALDKIPDFQVVGDEGKSLSYWHNAWLKFKVNRKALYSLYILVFLSLFSLLGPVLWQVDPAEQDVTQISQMPSLGKSTLIIANYSSWNPPQLDPALIQPHWAGLKLIDQATTESVKLEWQASSRASYYAIYRHELQPSGMYDLGLPLGETVNANSLGYEDKLKLETIHYFYSVVAMNSADEAIEYLTLPVTVRHAMKLNVALEKIKAGSILQENTNKNDAALVLGQKIKLPVHPMGTDYLGRDMMARLMLGGQTSLLIGFMASLCFVALGFVYGSVSGYLGGRVDNLMMRFADFVIALPFLLFMILLRVAFGVGPGESGITAMIVSLIMLSWPGSARLVRGQVLQLREHAFIQAARMNGANLVYIMLKHLLPNVLGLVLVSLTFAVPAVILTEAFLSFIGLGVVPPIPSWGAMCNDGIKTFLFHPHELFFPALFISATVLAFNLLGDGLRDALDVKTKD